MRHRLHHHGADSDAGAMTDFDIAENFCASPDQYASANLRMAVFVLLARAAERHAVQNRNVILDDCGLAADEAGGVIEKDSAPDPRRWIDVGLKYRRRPALQIV